MSDTELTRLKSTLPRLGGHLLQYQNIVQNFSITLNPTTHVEEIKSAFSAIFPYLKWEFFTAPHKAKEGNTKKDMVAGNPKVCDLTDLKGNIQIDFSEQTTVQELEKKIEDQLGLHIQVFRRSGNIWLETTVTDEWTLSFQNEQGKELSEQFDRKK